MDNIHKPKIIFDWDDTLLASFHLHNRGYNIFNTDMSKDPSTLNELKALATNVRILLEMAIKTADVTILTNSVEGWVKDSAEAFMPEVVPILSQCRIISARSTYEKDHPTGLTLWKYFALIDNFNSDEISEIISFGDADNDRYVVSLFGSTREIKCKTIKFIDNPSIVELKAQLDTIIVQLNYITTSKETLTLNLIIGSISELQYYLLRIENVDTNYSRPQNNIIDALEIDALEIEASLDTENHIGEAVAEYCLAV